MESQPSSRTGENPPYGMIGRIEETSASFEARYAPRSYPTTDVPTCDMAVAEVANRSGRTQGAWWLNLPPLLARRVFLLKTAFEYLSRVLSRESVPKFDNSRDLKVREFLCEELLYLLCSQRCLTVRLHYSNE